MAGLAVVYDGGYGAGARTAFACAALAALGVALAADRRDALADNAEANGDAASDAQDVAETGDRKKYIALVNERTAPLTQTGNELAAKLGAPGCGA